MIKEQEKKNMLLINTKTKEQNEQLMNYTKLLENMILDIQKDIKKSATVVDNQNIMVVDIPLDVDE